MLVKTQRVNKLYYGKYRYKMSLLLIKSFLFRHGSMDIVINKIINNDFEKYTRYNKEYTSSIEQKNYSINIANILKDYKKGEDYMMVCGGIYGNIYTSNIELFDTLINVNTTFVKKICKIPDEIHLNKNEIYLPHNKFEYKITIKPTTENFKYFVNHIDTNPDIELTRQCRKHLLQDRSIGNSVFYIRGGDGTLNICILYLGCGIKRIEKIIHK